MNIILTGGGTAGHISPALAVFYELKKRLPDSNILYIGRLGGLEEILANKTGIKFIGLQISGLYRTKTWNSLKANCRAAKNYLISYFNVRKILKNFKPDVIFATGGYVSAPIISAALSLNIKVALHEQNERLGLTTKLFKRKVAALLLPSENSISCYKKRTKQIVKVVGNPINEEFGKTSKKEARDILGLSQDKFCIVSYGGSLGAKKINKIIADLFLNNDKLKDLQWIHATGKKNYEEFIKYLEKNNFEPEKHKNIIIKSYIFNMPCLFNAVDLVISRAGAMSIAELQAAGKVGILIPSPNVTSNHQFFNAKALAQKGAALVLEESQATASNLMKIINDLLENPKKLCEISQKAKSMHITNSAKLICDVLIGISKN